MVKRGFRILAQDQTLWVTGGGHGDGPEGATWRRWRRRTRLWFLVAAGPDGRLDSFVPKSSPRLLLKIREHGRTIGSGAAANGGWDSVPHDITQQNDQPAIGGRFHSEKVSGQIAAGTPESMHHQVSGFHREFGQEILLKTRGGFELRPQFIGFLQGRELRRRAPRPCGAGEFRLLVPAMLPSGSGVARAR